MHLSSSNLCPISGVQLYHASTNLLMFQAYADLFILTVLLHFSGSIENPLAPLMLFHVVIAGIILSRRQCFTVALVASLMFAILAGLELAGVVHHYTLAIFPHDSHDGATLHAAREPLYVASQIVLQATILLLSAFFVTTLADRLRRDEQQLRANAERIATERQLLTQALETTGTALCVCDQMMVPKWQNRQWTNWFGRSTTDSDLYEQIYGEGSPAYQTARDGKVRVGELELTEGRTSQTLLSTTAPLRTASGEINRIVQIAQDITTQKATQEGMLRAGKLAAVGEMAGEVAHEVNNPIAIISAKARLLLANHRTEISDKVADELVKMTELSDRIARITQGLLSYSRPAAGPKTRLDARIPVRKALAMIEHRAAKGHIRVDDRLPEQPFTVDANAAELEQAFLNIFLNSLDAMAEGGTLTITGTANEESWSIVVNDTGCGIDTVARERAFEPFYTTKPEGKGTGLGLSICVGLIRSQGGTIDIEGEPDVGATVTVALPHANRMAAHG